MALSTSNNTMKGEIMVSKVTSEPGRVDPEMVGGDENLAKLPSFGSPAVELPASLGEAAEAPPVPVVDDVAAPAEEQPVAPASAGDAEIEITVVASAPAGADVGVGQGAGGAGTSAPETEMSDPELDELTKPRASAGPTNVDPLDVLRAVVDQVMASEKGQSPGGPRHAAADLAGVAQHLKLDEALRPEQLAPVAPAVAVPLTGGQRVQVQGVNALAEGVGALVGGTMALAGAVGRGVGWAAKEVAASLGPGTTQAAPPPADVLASTSLPAVLPRLSEYRIAQAEKAASAYNREQEAFWGASPALAGMRDELAQAASASGRALKDVVAEVRPGGTLADMRARFDQAVADSPEAVSAKRAMGKALDSYILQFGRAQEELLNPEQEGDPHYENLRQRLERTQAAMEVQTEGVPAFTNARGQLEPTHFEKLQEAITRVLAKMREVAQEVMAMLRGKRGADHGPGL